MNKKMILILLIVFAISLPVFANKQEADDCLKEELAKLDKLGFTPVKKLQWLGTLNGGNQFKKAVVLEKGTKYQIVAGTDTQETGLTIEIINSKNHVVAKTTNLTSPLFLEYKPVKSELHTFKITNTTNKNFWLFIGLTEKTKEADDPEPVEPIDPLPPVEPEPPAPEPVFPPDVKPIKPNPLPTVIIDIPIPATKYPDKSSDGLPMPKISKIESIPNYFIASMKGDAKKSTTLHNFKTGEIGRLYYSISAVIPGKTGYLHTVEFWLKNQGLALIVGPKGKITYAKVSKNGYENFVFNKDKMEKLPKVWKADIADKTLLHVSYFGGTPWIFVNKVPVMKFEKITGTLPFFVRVCGAAVILSETKPKPEEKIIIIDSKPNKEIYQELGTFNKIPMKFKAEILKKYADGVKLMEFWFNNKQAVSLLELEDGTFNLYTFVNRKYKQLDLPKSFTFDNTEKFSITALRKGSFVILKLNDVELAQIRDISKRIQFKLRLYNYKFELTPN